MSEDKKRFSARVEIETLETLDEYAEDRGLTRSQAVETITGQWADLTEHGDVHPALVKTRSETTNSLLAGLREDKLLYVIAGLVTFLVYDYVALPTLAVPVVLFLAASWSVAGIIGHFVEAADRFGLTTNTVDDVEVEA